MAGVLAERMEALKIREAGIRRDHVLEPRSEHLNVSALNGILVSLENVK
jgi:hypothetical protein